MTAPRRIQLSRKKGWRKPEGTVVVARPTKWGNPFRIGDRAQATAEAPVAACFSAREAVDAYRDLVNHPSMAEFRATAAHELRGKHLACWCPLDRPCHADVLLELANREPEVTS